MKIWKQKYDVTFKVSDDIEINAYISLTNQEKANEEFILESGRSLIKKDTGLEINELDSHIETLVMVKDKKEPMFLAAVWLLEDGRDPEFYDWNDYQDAISGAGVEEENVDFEGLKNYFEMVIEMDDY